MLSEQSSSRSVLETGKSSFRTGGRYFLTSFLELPLLPTHGAGLVDLLGVQPLHDAVDVEAVGTLAPDQGAVITRHLAVGAASVEVHPANAAVVIICHPPPGCHPCPSFLCVYCRASNFCFRGSNDKAATSDYPVTTTKHGLK